MANLTNSAKLIEKLSDIDSKIGSIPAGTDIGQELSDIDDKIGTVPAGENLVDMIGDASDAASAASTAASNAATAAAAAQTTADNAATAAANAAQAAADVADDLSAFETEVASTYATKAEITSVYKYKGSVATFADLPSSGQVTGDVYNVESDGMNYAWNGSAWDALGGVVDLSDYFNKSNDDSDDITEGSTHLFLTSAERTKLGNTSGTNTGDQSASDFDIKDLADSTDLRTTWSGKQEAISDLATIRSGAAAGATALQASDATYVSNTVSEANTGTVTVTAADNVTIATAETNNKSAIAALGTAHNNLVTRVAAVESATGSLPFTAKFADAVFSNSTTAVLNDASITAQSHISWVVKTGAITGYSIEPEVEAGKVTFTSSAAETATLRVLIINEVTA